MLTSSHRSRWLLVLVCVAALVLSAPAAALAGMPSGAQLSERASRASGGGGIGRALLGVEEPITMGI